MIRAVLAVAIKEFRQIRRDPLSLAMLVGVPALMLLLYGYALNFDVEHVKLAVQDRDLSTESRALLADFTRSRSFDVVATLPIGAPVEPLFERRVAKAVLVIPENYGATRLAGGTARVQILIDGSDATTASTVLSYATAIAGEASLAFRDPTGNAPVLVTLEPRVWFNPELTSSHFLVPGLMGFILMITAVVSTALSIVREKERGTMEQLQVSPMGTTALLAGKVIPYLLISLLAAATIVGAAQVLFGVPVRGSYAALFAVTLVYLIGALGLGLLVSSVFASQALAFQAATLVSMLPAIFLSGFIFPLRSMPDPLQVISYVVPARYFLTVVRGIMLKGTGLGPYPDQMLFLGLYAVLVFGWAFVRLARAEVRR